jgi:hypothetical protein
VRKKPDSKIRPKEKEELYRGKGWDKRIQSSFDPYGTKWWQLADDSIHKGAFAAAEFIRRHTVGLAIGNQAYANAYEDREMGLYGNSTGGIPGAAIPYASNLTFNVVGSCIDGLRNKVFKEPVRVRAVTEKGDYMLQRQAENVTQFLDGEHDAAGVPAAMRRLGRDGLVYGQGYIWPYYDQAGNYVVERKLVDDVIVDPRDGRMMNPTQMFLVSIRERSVLYEMYPDCKDAIRDSQLQTLGPFKGHSIVDQVLVLDCYHMKSGPNAKDGIHVTCVDGGILSKEDWNFDFYPVVTFRYEEPLVGWHGNGIANMLLPQQAHINKLLNIIDEAESMACMPRVFVEQNSGVIPEHLFNPGGICFYQGAPPQFNTAPGLSAEVYQELDREMQYPYKRVGLSELTAQSEKPVGLNAAVALREYHDIETERFSDLALRWEQCHIELATMTIAMARKVVKAGQTITARTKGYGFIKTMDWKDIDLPDEKFSIELWPVSNLPRTPEGRIEQVQELAQSGYIDRATALELLDMPDVSAATARMNASLERCNYAVCKILYDGVYEPPDQFYAAGPDAQMSMAIFRAEVNKAYTTGVPKNKIMMLIRWLEDAMQINGLPIVPPQPAPPNPVQAVPQPPPQSALLPNSPPQQ